MSFSWYRMHRSILQSRKIMQLSSERFRAWVLCMAMAEGDDGHLPSIDDIAFNLRTSPEAAEAIINDLIEARLIDIQPSGRRVVHGWAEHQYKKSDHDVNERKRRSRAKARAEKSRSQAGHGGRSQMGHVTCHDFPSESESVSASVPQTTTVEVIQELDKRTRGSARVGVRENAYLSAKEGQCNE